MGTASCAYNISSQRGFDPDTTEIVTTYLVTFVTRADQKYDPVFGTDDPLKLLGDTPHPAEAELNAILDKYDIPKELRLERTVRDDWEPGW